MEKFLFSQKKIFFYKLEKKYGKIGYNVGPYRKLYFFIIYRIEKWEGEPPDLSGGRGWAMYAIVKRFPFAFSFGLMCPSPRPHRKTSVSVRLPSPAGRGGDFCSLRSREYCMGGNFGRG